MSGAMSIYINNESNFEELIKILNKLLDVEFVQEKDTEWSSAGSIPVLH